MSGNIDLGAIAKRLDRIEERFRFLDDLINPVDPPPDDWGWGGRPQFNSAVLNLRLSDLLKRLRPGLGGDPPPEDLGRGGFDISSSVLNLRLSDLIRKILPGRGGDPPPIDLTRANVVDARLNEIYRRNPGWFADPPPEDFLNVRILDLIRRWRGGFTDPAPDDIAGVRLRDLIQRIPGGGFSDPPPDDIAHLTRPELEAQLHRINAELVRLKSLERMIADRLNKAAAK